MLLCGTTKNSSFSFKSHSVSKKYLMPLSVSSPWKKLEILKCLAIFFGSLGFRIMN